MNGNLGGTIPTELAQARNIDFLYVSISKRHRSVRSNKTNSYSVSLLSSVSTAALLARQSRVPFRLNSHHYLCDICKFFYSHFFFLTFFVVVDWIMSIKTVFWTITNLMVPFQVLCSPSLLSIPCKLRSLSPFITFFQTNRLLLFPVGCSTIISMERCQISLPIHSYQCCTKTKNAFYYFFFP
jgi:hypothetical protein